MEALHRLLQNTGETLDEGEDLEGFERGLAFADDEDIDIQYFDDNKDDEEHVQTPKSPSRNHRRNQDTQDVEEVEEWRPLSPGGEGRSDPQYDEEC